MSVFTVNLRENLLLLKLVIVYCNSCVFYSFTVFLLVITVSYCVFIGLLFFYCVFTGLLFFAVFLLVCCFFTVFLLVSGAWYMSSYTMRHN